MSRRPTAFGAALLVSSLVACQAPPTEAPVEPRVTATFSILADLVGRVGGDDIALSVLVPTGSDPHNFVPSPRHFAAVADADLLVGIGAGFEPWLDDVVRGGRFRGRVLVTADGLDLLTTRGGAPDPHIWLDARQAAAMVTGIRDALAELAPERREAFERRAAALQTELAGLDARVERTVAELPAERRRIVTAHDSLGYYARRYGLEVVGTVLLSHSTETGDPSAAHLAHLVEEIRRRGAVAIFPDNVHTPPLLARLARETGVRVGPPLPTGSLEPEGPATTYIGMMDETTRRIVETLR